MSRINAIRLININYNDNQIRINDEYYELKGRNTLFALRNGGGKSVLVQMLTAPFVHKSYRNTKDRPFAGYFTSQRPSYILVEWALDGNAGYVLTGLMVRKSQEMYEESGSEEKELEIIGIISEYRERCSYDIQHLPVVEKNKKQMVLKSFGSVKQLFENYKKDSDIKFFSYDLNGSSTQKQYFDKLADYQIYYKEWESIIKKVNLKESGLSELFADCKDEKGLVEKWFIDAIENKLNKDRSRIKEFAQILSKYVFSYKDNKSKIERRDIILRFKEEMKPVYDELEKCLVAEAGADNERKNLAILYMAINRMKSEARTLAEELKGKISDKSAELSRLKYERISSEIYAIEDEKNIYEKDIALCQIELEDLKRGLDEYKRQLHILEAAKLMLESQDEEREELAARQALQVCVNSEKELEPERIEKGQYIYKAYSQKLTECEGLLNKEQAGLKVKENELKDKREELDRTYEKLSDNKVQIAKLSAAKALFDKREDDFNRKYSCNLSRNILGLYEDGELQILKLKNEEEITKNTEEKKELSRSLERREVSLKELKFKQEELKEEKGELEISQKLLIADKGRMDEAKEKRLRTLRYIGLSEESVFDTEKITGILREKQAELNRVRANNEGQIKNEKRELDKVKSGSLSDLPESLSSLLDKLSIEYVQGYEWLLKNGKKKEENAGIIKRLPILPYSIIMSLKDIERLKQTEAVLSENIPVPVPIIARESLVNEDSYEKSLSKATCVYNFDELYFCIYFNKELLSVKGLKDITGKIEDKLAALEEELSRGQAEIDEYGRMLLFTAEDGLNKRNYYELINKLEATANQLEVNQQQYLHSCEDENRLAKEIEEGQKALNNIENNINHLALKAEEIEEFTKEYVYYLENKSELDECRELQTRLEDRRQLLKQVSESIEGEIKRLNNTLEEIRFTRKHLSEKRDGFEEYKVNIEDDFKFEESDFEEIIARYKAITESFGADRRLLEERLKRAGERSNKIKSKLERYMKKYGLEAEELAKALVNEQEEERLEAAVNSKEERLNAKREEEKKIQTSLARVGERYRIKMEELSLECGEEAPLPREELVNKDFASLIKTAEYERNLYNKELEGIVNNISIYEGHESSLSEYADIEVTSEEEATQNYMGLGDKDISDTKGILIRDLKGYERRSHECHNSLQSLAGRIARMDCFADDYFRKPLENFMEITGNTELAKSQLDITIESYDELMEKIMVDISLVEKERAKILELLLEYVHQVNDHMGKIDKNSTITVRQRPLKMLRIVVPSWEDNLQLYSQRITDYIDQVTAQSVESLEKNENAMELIGRCITTKALYDTVVGMNNVQIGLYKIEESREKQISWAGVAKNSGGEGFVSAFVILTSLLHYMRRDELDIFAQKKEGKVLIMDNPFAQTNAAHLLRPVIEMSKNTDTQFIALSGLGGDSIYNRFDNIYVLNLVASSLGNGTSYLKSERLTGSSEEELVSSQIEVYEQTRLF